MIAGLQYVSGYLDGAEQDALLDTVSDLELIVTEYEPGEGIRPHIDAPMFADVIVGVALARRA